MATGIVVFILLAVAALNIWYMIRTKKNNRGCTGCPYAGQCGKKTCDHLPKERDKKNTSD